MFKFFSVIAISCILTAPAFSQNCDTNDNYKYNYRCDSGDYNYDVEGSDSYGDDVNGNLTMNGKYGSGTIENSDGDEIEVEAEWVGYGQIEATDEDGEVYDLEVD